MKGCPANIFYKKTLFFTSEYVIYTERQWLSNLFCYCKICKHLFLQSAILQFQFYSLSFPPIFGNKFFDNCKCHIYIICSKNWMKIRLHLMSLRAIKLCWNSFLHIFLEPQIISKSMFLRQHCNE